MCRCCGDPGSCAEECGLGHEILDTAEAAGARSLPYHPVDDVTETAAGWRLPRAEHTYDVDHAVFAPGPGPVGWPVFGELVAELVLTGTTSHDIDRLDPARFA